jgi:hypothetical protein
MLNETNALSRGCDWPLPSTSICTFRECWIRCSRLDSPRRPEPVDLVFAFLGGSTTQSRTACVENLRLRRARASKSAHQVNYAAGSKNPLTSSKAHHFAHFPAASCMMLCSVPLSRCGLAIGGLHRFTGPSSENSRRRNGIFALAPF